MQRKRLIRLGVIAGALAVACVAVFQAVTAPSKSGEWQMWFLVVIPVLAVAACWDLVSSLPYARRVRLILAPAVFFPAAGPALRFLYSHDPSVRPPDYDGGDDKAYALYLIFSYGVGIVGFSILAIRMGIRAIQTPSERAQNA
jgi:hypothetical protein